MIHFLTDSYTEMLFTLPTLNYKYRSNGSRKSLPFPEQM